jgi:protease-4
MLEDLFLQEIFSPLFLHESGLKAVDSIVAGIRAGKKISETGIKQNHRSGIAFPESGDPGANPFDSFEEGSVAVIPITGMMFKYNYWWNNGCDYIADLIRLADKSAQIAGILLLMDTPGGTSSSLIQLEDALRNRTKKAVALIDYMCCSGGMYVACLCDEIYAMNPMSEAGSIGVYVQLIDEREADKRWGYTVIEIYPPESSRKNLPVREALDNKSERIIREELTPAAVHFQNLVKENRPELDLRADGVLQGRVFFATDAVKIRLIDGIMNLEQAIARVKTLHDTQQSIYSLLK